MRQRHDRLASGPRPRGVCGSSADAFRGFTLIEVLVAFSILAMSLGVLFQIFATGLRGTRLAEEYSHAVLLAESELARLRIQPSAAAAAALGEGEVEVDARYDQTVSVEAITDASLTAIAATTLRPYRVTVEMSWGEGSHRRSVPLTTVMLYRTPPGEGP